MVLFLQKEIKMKNNKVIPLVILVSVFCFDANAFQFSGLHGNSSMWVAENESEAPEAIAVEVDDNPAASSETNATDGDKSKSDDVSQFGFGPAFFVLDYDKEILKDSKDVRVRGDGSIDASGTDYSTSFGLEVHYDFSFGDSQVGNRNSDGSVTWLDSYTGHKISPFLGLFDLENGINGLVIGVLYGYWKSDEVAKTKTSLNVGIGTFIHKDQLVLSNGVVEGEVPDSTLTPEDYTSREDVKGITVMISASIGF